MQRLIAAVALIVMTTAAQAASKAAPQGPADAAIPALAASLASRLSARVVHAPDGTDVALGAFLDAERVERCLRTISKGDGWPASWLIVSDSAKPYDLILRVALAPDGSIQDPDTAFFARRVEWDDAAFEAAFVVAMGRKPPREKQRNVVIQSFTHKTNTDYVYDLPATGKGAKGLLAFLPEGSLLREAAAIDLGDNKHHTVAIVLVRPKFVPADCTTAEGRRKGHRDEGGVVLYLAGETATEDKLDITEAIRSATGATLVPRFPCESGDSDPGAIDALVDRKFEGREPIRLLDFSGRSAQCQIKGLPIVIGIKRDNDAFKLFAHPTE